MLPTIGDLKFSKLDFDYTCAYTEKEYAPYMDSRKYMLELRAYCNKVKPFVTYYKKLINSYNNAAHNILEKEIKLLLPQVSKRIKMRNHNHCGIKFYRFRLMKVYPVSFNIKGIMPHTRLSML